MGEPDSGDRPVTASELADLRTALTDLQTAQQELRDAQTERERREASRDVGEAKQDLDAVAASLGISRESLERAAVEAKSAERRDELKPILKDLLAELRGEEEEAERQRKEAEAAAKGKAKPKPAKPAADDPSANGATGDEPPADDGPSTSHWSERPIFGRVSS